MRPEYLSLRVFAKQAENVERMVLAHENQMRRFVADGFSEMVFTVSDYYTQHLRRERDRLMKECGRAMKGHPLHEWASSVCGMGDALFFTLGLIPIDLEDFRTVSGLWKYTGLHTEGGRAVRRKTGVFLGFNARLRAYATQRVALPHVKQRRSPYRAVYDDRKAYTADRLMLGEDKSLRHPWCEHCQAALVKTDARRAERALERERAGVGFDCADLGGPHWSPKHRDTDALRVMAKAILRDVWRVAHGLEPKAGAEDQKGTDAQVGYTPALAAA